MTLEGQVVLVTGAARGMGAAVAKRCVAEGAELALVDRDPAVRGLAEQLGCSAYVGNVTDSALATSVVNETLERHGRLTGLVNVAGIHTRGTALEVTDEEWQLVMSVNLTGPMTWVRAALPALTALGGSVVNFASIAGSHARPDCAAYTASKAGLIGFTRSVALDFGARGVRANTLSPGSIDTPMFREHEARGGAGREAHVPRIPLGRLGSTDEIAATVAFLLSPGAAYISGLDVIVDGGRVATT